MYKTESFKPDDFKPARFESKGTITLRGNEIPYHTVSEDNVFYGKDGKAIASIFSYSYFRSDVEDTSRPTAARCRRAWDGERTSGAGEYYGSHRRRQTPVVTGIAEDA